MGAVGLDLAFTDRHGTDGPLDLQWPGAPGATSDGSGLGQVADVFGGSGPVVGMRQVHGAHVAEVDENVEDAALEADGLVTRSSEVSLLVRVADCVPVLLADVTSGVIGVAHAGRLGVVGEVVPATVARMRALGADRIEAWVGPHACGRCYEVPAQMRAEVASVVASAHAETSWGTPAVDLGAAVRFQLEEAAVTVHDVSRCTVEDEDLWSYRRQGPAAGRLGGLIRMHP